MDPKLVFPAALLLLLSLVGSGAGLKCYQCNSYEDALCADPFIFKDQPNWVDPLGLGRLGPAKSGTDFEKECPNDGKAYFCRKIYQNVRDDVRVIRSCGWIPGKREGDCYTTVLEEYNTEVCKCDGDLCNTASLSKMSVMAILPAVVLGYLIH